MEDKTVGASVLAPCSLLLRICVDHRTTSGLDDRRPRNHGTQVPRAFHAHQTEVQLRTAAASSPCRPAQSRLRFLGYHGRRRM
jgi:hypothetical protein